MNELTGLFNLHLTTDFVFKWNCLNWRRFKNVFFLSIIPFLSNIQLLSKSPLSVLYLVSMGLWFLNAQTLQITGWCDVSCEIKGNLLLSEIKLSAVFHTQYQMSIVWCVEYANRLPASWRCDPVLSLSEILLQSVFLGIWRIADEGHQPHAASRQDVERGRSTTIGNSTEPSAINPDQHLWNPQDCLNKTSHLQPS